MAVAHKQSMAEFMVGFGVHATELSRVFLAVYYVLHQSAEAVAHIQFKAEPMAMLEVHAISRFRVAAVQLAAAKGRRVRK